LDSRPTSRRQNYDRKWQTIDILLINYILVRGNENFEAFPFRRSQQNSVG